MLEFFNPTVILLVFYLYLLVRWQYVKRPLLFLLGSAGVLFALVGGFFNFEATVSVLKIFHTIGSIVAFAAGVGACYGAALPVNLPGIHEAGDKPT